AQRLNLSTGPSNGHLGHLRLGPESEVQARIVLRDIASSRSHFAHLHRFSRLYRDARSDRHAVALRANQLEEDAMIVIPRAIDQQRGKLADIQDHDVHISVVVDIAESRAPSAMRGKSGHDLGNVLESAIAVVAEQLHRLTIRWRSLNLVDLGI